MTSRFRPAVVAILLVVAVSMIASCAEPPGPGPQFGPEDPITLGDGGVAGNGNADGASVSADGRWTAFRSAATNLVVGDNNGVADTFLRDNRSGSVVRIAEATLEAPAISRNGRYVGLKFADAFTYGVYDRTSGTSVTWSEMSGLSVPVVTDDGTKAVYGAGSSLGIFPVSCTVRDLVANVAKSCPWGPADWGSVALVGVSGNGRWVMYHWNDQSGTDTSGYYLWDVTSPAPVALAGTFLSLGVTNVVSDDGSTIFAAGFGETLPPKVYDVASGQSQEFPVVPDGFVVPTGISPDGRWLSAVSDATNLVEGDLNGTADVFLLDRTDGSITLSSRNLDTGEPLELGAMHCGKFAGQVLNGGRICVIAADEISSVDNNGVPDGFLVPGP